MLSILACLLLTYVNYTAASVGGYVYEKPVKSINLFEQVINQNELGHRNTFPQFISNQGANYGLKYNPINFGLPLVDNYLPEVDTYIVNGRILKQYLVMEHQPEDNFQHQFLGPRPISYDDFSRAYSPAGKVQGSFFPALVNKGRTQLTPVTPNHGPVALGSGSIGYITLPNGGVFLGSGSLGYISGRQRIEDIIDARTRQGGSPSPLTFGHGPLDQ